MKTAELDIIVIDRNNTLLTIEVKNLEVIIDKNETFCRGMNFNNIRKQKVKMIR